MVSYRPVGKVIKKKDPKFTTYIIICKEPG
jgi:hypothetical protein